MVSKKTFSVLKKLIAAIKYGLQVSNELPPSQFWSRHIACKPLNLLEGDAGVEPATFGSGDQRSIH